MLAAFHNRTFYVDIDMIIIINQFKYDYVKLY